MSDLEVAVWSVLIIKLWLDAYTFLNHDKRIEKLEAEND